MNPASSTALDPKLKEVYDRVMGTSTVPPKQPNASLPSQPSFAGTVAPSPAASSPKPVTANPMAPQATTPHTTAPASQISSIQHTVPPPRPAAVSGAPTTASAIDYAALAAKYATPPPRSVEAPQMMATPPAQQKAETVTPSTTTYGIVNNSAEGKKEKSIVDSDSKGQGMKKIMLVVGILLFLVIYTFVWVVVFGIELPF